MKFFYVCLDVDNGMERFMWNGYVFAEDAKKAVECVIVKKGWEDDITRTEIVTEYHPKPGDIFQR